MCGDPKTNTLFATTTRVIFRDDTSPFRPERCAEQLMLSVGAPERMILGHTFLGGYVADHRMRLTIISSHARMGVRRGGSVDR
jgi:hypothetical protein